MVILVVILTKNSGDGDVNIFGPIVGDEAPSIPAFQRQEFEQKIAAKKALQEIQNKLNSADA